MRTYTCFSCHFSFTEADKAWDEAINCGRCPKCSENLRSFPVPVRQRPSVVKEVKPDAESKPSNTALTAVASQTGFNFCPQCGCKTILGAHYCSQCGLDFNTTIRQGAPSTQQQISALVSKGKLVSDLHDETASSSLPITASRAAIVKVRPWVRYWARMFDAYLFSFFSVIILAVIAPQFLEKQNEYALGMMLVFAWVFVEALLLSSFQTTPGKWFFKTKIALTSGLPINFSQALARSFKVWWRGIGTGFPIAAMITMLIAYGRLTRNRITSWDKDDGFTVEHETIGVPRVLASIAIFLVFLLLVAIGNTVNP